MALEQPDEFSKGPAQPGQVVVPGGQPVTAAPSLNPVQQQSSQQPVPPPAAPAPQNEAPPTSAETSNGDISWTASEFIAHDKSSSWYLGLAVGSIALAGIIYLLTRDKISSGIILLGAFLFGVVAHRKPRQLQYRLSSEGITVGEKYYAFADFKSFSVAQEGAFSSIVFSPMKRFAPLLTIYYAPPDEDKIIDLLSDRLPFEEHKLDAVDSLMKRVRF